MLNLFSNICLFVGYKFNTNFNSYGLKLNKNHRAEACNDKTLPCYHAFIGLILITEPCYYFYKIISNSNDLANYPNIFFSLIGFSNFIIGIRYFKKKYFFNITRDVSVYKKDMGKIKALYDDKILSVIILLSSLSSLVLNLLLSVFDFNSIGPVYDFNNQTEIKYLIMIYSVIDILYKNFILCINLLVFVMVFYMHYNELKTEHEKLQKQFNIADDSGKNFGLECSSMCYDILWIRSQLENSIKNLQSLYLVNTLLGSIALGFIFELDEITPSFIISSIYWLISQIVFFIVIFMIEDKKGDLIKLIKKPKFYIHYLKKRYNNSGNFFKEFIGNYKKDRQGEYLIEACSTTTRNDKSGGHIINEGSDEENNDSTIIEMGEMRQPLEIDILLQNVNNEDVDEEYIDNIVNNKILQNNSSLDWVILNTILTEEWDCFEFIGFKFNNSDSIQNSLAITTGLILLTDWFINITLI